MDDTGNVTWKEVRDKNAWKGARLVQSHCAKQNIPRMVNRMLMLHIS